MSNECFDDKPKLLGSLEARVARRAELCVPHIAPLTTFVDALRAEKGSDYKIPYFDPWDGGIAAEVLFLLEAPGPKAVKSGFISRNNPDESAKNFFELNQQAGILRKRTTLWNIVPWFICSGSRIRAANSVDIHDGIRSLKSVLDLLPNLRAIVLVGKKAQYGKFRIEKLCSNIKFFNSPHPSPQFVNRAPYNRKAYLPYFKKLQIF